MEHCRVLSDSRDSRGTIDFFLSFSFLSLSPFEIYVLCMSGAVDSVTPSLLKTGTCFSFYYGW